MKKYSEKSLWMRLCVIMGLPRLAWSLRRLHCPVDDNALVLDVGSGNNPYPRANVLLDAYEDTIERYHSELVKDRPLVVGNASRMPFKDKAFDFVIASHILEHMDDPAAFLQELMRVAKGGYIETPHAFLERINPFRFHRLEISTSRDRIRIWKKSNWRHDAAVVDLYEGTLKGRAFTDFISNNPYLFNNRIYWADKIEFEIVNPDIKADWPFPKDESSVPPPSGWRVSLRAAVRLIVRRLCSQNRRNKRIDLLSLMQCPACACPTLSRRGGDIVCPSCQTVFPIRSGIIIMTPNGGVSSDPVI